MPIKRKVAVVTVFEMHDFADPLTIPSRDEAHEVPPARRLPPFHSTEMGDSGCRDSVCEYESTIGAATGKVVDAAPDVRVEAQLS